MSRVISRATAAARTLVAACAAGTIGRRKAGAGATESITSAWDAWRAGDVAGAREQSGLAIQRGESDAACHVFALTAHVAGDHAAAIAAQHAIGARYRRLSELDEPILWSHLRLGDVAAAHAFAEQRGLLRNRATKERLRLAAERPLRMEMSGVIECGLQNRSRTGRGAGLDEHARVLGVPAPPAGRFAEIPGPIALGALRQNGLTAVAVPNRVWRDFGDWNGMRVDALLSHRLSQGGTRGRLISTGTCMYSIAAPRRLGTRDSDSGSGIGKLKAGSWKREAGS